MKRRGLTGIKKEKQAAKIFTSFYIVMMDVMFLG